jgi:hypothetical protein
VQGPERGLYDSAELNSADNLSELESGFSPDPPARSIALQTP